MAIKAVNNSAGPNRLVPTLLVFSIYLQLLELDLSSLFITMKAKAIRTTIKKVQQLYIKQQVQDVLIIRNRPNTKITLNLPF